MTFTVFERKNQFLIERKDGVSSYTSNICQQKLKQRGIEFIGKLECPLKSPNCDPLDHNFWDALKTGV